MATKLFAATKSGSFIQSGTIATSTLAGTFDSSFVANSIKISPGGAAVGFVPVTSTEFWLFFGNYHTDGGSGSGDAPILEIINSSGVSIVQIWRTNNNFALHWWNGTGYTTASLTTLFGPNVLYRSGVRVVFGASSSVTFYRSGAPVVVWTLSSTSIDNVRQFKLGPGYNNSGSWASYFSEVYAADYDISTSRVMAAALNGNSTVNVDGTGTYTDVSDDSDATGANVPAVGNKRGFTHASLAVGAGLQIGSVCVNLLGAVTSPATNGKAGLRLASTNYSSASLGFDGSYKPLCGFWDVNPNSTLSWTQTDFNNTEAYFEAA